MTQALINMWGRVCVYEHSLYWNPLRLTFSNIKIVVIIISWHKCYTRNHCANMFHCFLNKVTLSCYKKIQINKSSQKVLNTYITMLKFHTELFHNPKVLVENEKGHSHQIDFLWTKYRRLAYCSFWLCNQPWNLLIEMVIKQLNLVL